MTPSTRRTTTPDTRTPVVAIRAPEGFEARWAAWNARGVEHDRAIRHQIGTAGRVALVAIAFCAAAWLSFGGAR
jgi:hypothetical protein